LGSLAETTEEMFDDILDANFRAAYFTVQKALPLLSDGGAIVFTTSWFDQTGVAGTSAVSASKAALRILDSDACLRADRPENPRQRCQPRRDRDAPFRQARPSGSRCPGTQQGPACADPGEALRQARGSRHSGGIPRL